MYTNREGSLWLSMGEQIRTGQWAPKKDPMPAEIQTMIDYAAAKDVKLMGYVMSQAISTTT